MKIKRHGLGLLLLFMCIFAFINDAMGLKCYRWFCSKNPKDANCKDFKLKADKETDKGVQVTCKEEEVCHLRVLKMQSGDGVPELVAETRDCIKAIPEFTCKPVMAGNATSMHTQKTDCVCNTELCNLDVEAAAADSIYDEEDEEGSGSKSKGSRLKFWYWPWMTSLFLLIGGTSL